MRNVSPDAQSLSKYSLTTHLVASAAGPLKGSGGFNFTVMLEFKEDRERNGSINTTQHFRPEFAIFQRNAEKPEFLELRLFP